MATAQNYKYAVEESVSGTWTVVSYHTQLVDAQYQMNTVYVTDQGAASGNVRIMTVNSDGSLSVY